jgi:hypothetical protein
MKKLSMLGVVVGGAFLCAAPISLDWSPAKLGLSVETAQARIGRPLTPFSVAGVNRRMNRRAYYGGYGGYYGQAYAQQPYYEQVYAQQPYDEQAYAQQPYYEQVYAQQPYYEQVNGQQPYNEQAYAQQPYYEQVYAQQPYYVGQAYASSYRPLYNYAPAYGGYVPGYRYGWQRW